MSEVLPAHGLRRVRQGGGRLAADQPDHMARLDAWFSGGVMSLALPPSLESACGDLKSYVFEAW